MKSSIISLFFFLLSFSFYFQSAAQPQPLADECVLNDPLIGWDFDYDFCCEGTNSVCYDIEANVANWNSVSSSNQFLFKSLGYAGGYWSSGVFFSNYEELADLMDALALSNGITVDFIWDPDLHTICAYDVDDNFQVLILCPDPTGLCNTGPNFGNSNALIDFAYVPAIYTYPPPSNCNITEPDVSSILNPTSEPVDLVLFNGTGGEISTHDIIYSTMNPAPNGSGPSPYTIGHILNAMAMSGALEFGAGCFNLNCIDLVAVGNQVALDPETSGELKEALEASGESLESFLAALSIELAGINFTQFVNTQLGLQIPDMGPCVGDMYAPIPFSGNNPPESKSKGGGGGNVEKSMMPQQGGTDADANYFGQTIPGLGLDGPGAAQPSPSAMELIKQIQGGVDLYNGSQSSSISLYNISANDISIPISLSSSNNGLKVDELGSLVGQNWNMNAGGMVTRMVKGLPDEFDGITEAEGAGRRYIVKPRIEIPSNVGISFGAPGVPCSGVTTDIATGILNGFTLLQYPPCNTLPPVYATIRWSPLDGYEINTTLSIFVVNIFGISIYVEVGYKMGITVNEAMGRVNYEETGLGFLHLDDSGQMSNMNLPAINPPLISAQTSDEIKRKILGAAHGNKGIEDVKFLSDQISNWAAGIQAINNLIGDDYRYKTNKIDTEPDEFYFSAGSYSGKFSFNVNGEPVFFPFHKGLSLRGCFKT